MPDVRTQPMPKKSKPAASADDENDSLQTGTLFQRYSASQRAAKHTPGGPTLESGAPLFFAALSHALKDQHCDPTGRDQWHLPLVLTTILASLYLRRWEVIFLLFAIYYLLEYALFFVVRRLTRRTTASITSRHQRSLELLTDPLIFVFALLAAWYTIDYSAFGLGVHGPAPWWYATVVLLVSLLSGHARLYWQTLLALLVAIWGMFAVFQLTTHSHHKHEYALWLSLRATAISLFFFAAFLQPVNGHYLHNAVFALLLWLFFISLLQFIWASQ